MGMPTKYDRNYYKILGLEPTAKLDEIKRAYRNLAKRFHPDSGETPDAEKFREITDAYDILSNPVSRMEYEKEYFKLILTPKNSGAVSGDSRSAINRLDSKINAGIPRRPPLVYSSNHSESNQYAYNYEHPDIGWYASADRIAEEKLREKIRTCPDSDEENHKARLELARMLLDRKKKPLECEKILEGAVKSDPYDPETAYLLGIAKCHQGQIADATHAFETCLQLNNNHIGAQICLICLRWRQDPSLNVPHYISKRALGYALEQMESHRPYMLLGDFYHSQRNYSESVRHLEKALRILPENSKAHLLMASSLWALGKRREAASSFRKAMMIDPNDLAISTSYSLHTNPDGTIRLGGISLRNPDIEITENIIYLDFRKNSAVELNVKKGDVLCARIAVIEGGNVNILTMKSSEFINYSSRAPFKYYPDGTVLDAPGLLFSISVPESSPHCIIIENSGFTNGGAEPDILNCGGKVIVLVQIAIGIPGGLNKTPFDSPFFGMPQRPVAPETHSRVESPNLFKRKREVRFHPY